MFAIERKEDAIVIFDGKNEILSGIRPLLRTAGGETIALRLAETEETEGCTRVLYNNEAGDFCRLNFLTREDRLCCEMSAALSEGKTLDSEGGAFLRMGEVQKVHKLLAIHRCSPWWTTQKHVDGLNEVPVDTQTMFWRWKKHYFQLFTLADGGFSWSAVGTPEGLEIAARGLLADPSRFSAKLFTLTAHESPFELGRMTAEAVNCWLGGHRRGAEERRYPEIFEYLGWCSWNAFYEDVNEEGVLAKAAEFREKGLPVRWFILDCGWSTRQGTSLYSFEENRKKFPHGLKSLKENLVSEGVRWMGAWQALIGDWDNIAEDSPIAREHPELLYRTRAGALIPRFDRASAFRFWDLWHTYLENQGVDFVKVDIQSAIGSIARGEIAPDEAARETHAGLEASVGIHFGGTCINCMGMSTENILNRPISGVARNSDDFFPKKENGFDSHVRDNAYNALYHSAFYHCDWDMWWSEHEDAQSHAYLRALSGGPIYISDPVGKTDPALIKPLIRCDGRIFRCPQSGCVTENEVSLNPSDVRNAFRVWNRCNGTLYLGIFALRGGAFRQKGEVAPADVPGCDKTREYLLYRSGTDTANFIHWASRIATDMHAGLSALYSMTPCVDGVAFVGLIDKYLSSAAIEKSVLTENSAMYMVCESGRIGYGCRRPHRAWVNGKEVLPLRAQDLYILDLPESPEEICVEIRFEQDNSIQK